MIQVANLSKSFGSRLLFEELGFSVGQRERVGLVGRNGCGKSTLLKILMNMEGKDDGTITLPKSYKLGFLNQHISFSKDTLLEECTQVLPEEYMYEYYRAEKILSGLGFTEEDFYRPPSEFSGGYQLRINLTKCLLEEPDLLLLDEPTNYLDILSLRWMRGFLNTYQGEAIIVTHDRDFMDSVCTHTMGIHRRKLKKVKGNTSKYYEQLKLEEEIHEKTKANRDKKIKQMQDFVTRFRAKASKATQAQSVMKKIEKMGSLESLEAEQVLGFQFNYEPTPAKKLAEIKDLAFGFDEPLFEDLNFDLSPNDCVAVIGKNGKGKTTLLNAVYGKFQLNSGEVKLHPTAKIGFYEQTNRKDLNPKATVAEEIESSNVELETAQVRGICGAMMFPGDDALKKIKVLSGGEQARVLLGKVIAHKNNVLLLDEPSNHLDMDSIEVLIDEISEFPGATMIVSHNEKILNHLANKLIVFDQGKAQFFNGNYKEFLEKIGWSEEEGSRKKKAKKDGELKEKDKESNSKDARAAKKELDKQVRSLEKLQKEKESEIEVLENKMKELSAQVSENPDGNIQDIYKEIGQIQIDIEKAYSELEETIAKLDSIKA